LPNADALVNLVANPLDAAYITPKLLWLQRYQPQLFEATHQFLTSTGFIVGCLTGVGSCDYTQAYGFHFFDIRCQRWDERAAAEIGIPLEKMPLLYPSTAIVGQVTEAQRPGLRWHAGHRRWAGCRHRFAGRRVVQLGQTVDQEAGGRHGLAWIM
jgi:sugar (pentulose or hexulose) kinase